MGSYTFFKLYIPKKPLKFFETTEDLHFPEVVFFLQVFTRRKWQGEVSLLSCSCLPFSKRTICCAFLLSILMSSKQSYVADHHSGLKTQKFKKFLNDHEWIQAYSTSVSAKGDRAD